jgi:hypothetical protein
LNEDTLIKTMPLPFGQRWLWLADANMVLLSPCLDERQREMAMGELQAHWRRSCIRVVEDGEVVETQPMSALSAG